SLFSFILPSPTSSPPFPYTTPFRSRVLNRRQINPVCVRSGSFPPLRLRLLVTDCCLIPMHEREQEQHPGTDQYRGHCRGINASGDRRSQRLNSSHLVTSYAVSCWKK